MTWFSANKTSDPQQVLKTLEELRDGLQTALGDDLISLIVFGDFVRPGEYDPRRSHVSLMLVLADVSTPVLDRAVQPISQAEGKLRLSVMTLTEEDLTQSCDVFPIKFVDMQEHHRLLCGRDLLAELNVAGDHLRLRCEQELKNLMIRLRFLYLHRARHTAALRAALVESIGLLLRLLTIGLTLKTGIAPEANEDILAAVRDEFGLDAASLQRVLDMKRRTVKVPKAEVRPLFNDYMQAVHAAATAVDQLEVTTES